MEKIVRVLQKNFPDCPLSSCRELAEVIARTEPLTPVQRLEERTGLMREYGPLEAYGVSVCQRLFGHGDLDQIDIQGATKFLDETDFQFHLYLFKQKHFVKGLGHA